MFRLLRTTLPAVALAAALAIASGCGGDDAPPEPTPDLGDLPSSGVLAVDRVIAAVRANDASALQAQVRYTSVACAATPPQGAGGPPACIEGEPDGTEVDVFPAAQCEGFWQRPDGINVARWPFFGAELYAAYRTPAGGYPAGPYAVVFRRLDGMSAGLGWMLIVSDDGITGVHFGCGETPEELLASQRLTDALIAPR